MIWQRNQQILYTCIKDRVCYIRSKSKECQHVKVSWSFLDRCPKSQFPSQTDTYQDFFSCAWFGLILSVHIIAEGRRLLMFWRRDMTYCRHILFIVPALTQHPPSDACLLTSDQRSPDLRRFCAPLSRLYISCSRYLKAIHLQLGSKNKLNMTVNKSNTTASQQYYSMTVILRDVSHPLHGEYSWYHQDQP